MAEHAIQMKNDYRLHVAQPTTLTIKHPDGRDLLVFHRDGTVTGEVEDAPEAAHIFVEQVILLWGRPNPAAAATRAELTTAEQED